MTEWNLVAAWLGILAGFLTGTAQGLFFHEEGWLGGYASWPRRMTRLGHISCFGLAFINLAFVFSARHLGIANGLFWPSVLFLTGAVTMPVVCYLSAWKKPARQWFFVPVLSLVAAALLFVVRILG